VVEPGIVVVGPAQQHDAEGGPSEQYRPDTARTAMSADD